MTEKALRWLSLGWKVGSQLVAVVSLAFLAGSYWAAIRSMPNRVQRNESQIALLAARLDTLTQEMRALRNDGSRQLCMQIAEKERTNWRRCFDTPHGGFP